MPFITVEVMAGRTPAQRRDFAHAVASAAVRYLDAAPDKVRIRFAELQRGDLFRGDELLPSDAGPED